MTEEITKVNEVYGTFSERFPVLYNRDGRLAKARKIIAVMADFAERPLDDLRVLDIGGCGDATRMPFPDKSFDCLICNHVYEHVDDQQALMAEIKRVLTDDGFCYFSAGSRFVLIEGHYFLPFLSWLPHWASDIYMKVFGRQGRYDVKLLSYRNLKKLLHDFDVHDYTLPILTEPERFEAHDLKQQNSLAFRIPHWFYRLAYPILPIWIWVLTKK
jgi:ubiquinone/menaquinone biosynthesis C-methylase UbiE